MMNRNLEMEYVDMYLIHIPLKLNPKVHKVPVSKEDISAIDLKGVWEKMEECQNLGLTKAIGVSNFSPKKLEELLSFAKIPPVINQVITYLLFLFFNNKKFPKYKSNKIEGFDLIGGDEPTLASK